MLKRRAARRRRGRASACPTTGYGQRVVAIVAPAATATRGRPDARGAAGALPSAPRGYKLPRALHVVDVVVRTEAGKVDYAWARCVGGADTEVPNE